MYIYNMYIYIIYIIYTYNYIGIFTIRSITLTIMLFPHIYKTRQGLFITLFSHVPEWCRGRCTVPPKHSVLEWSQKKRCDNGKKAALILPT